MYKIKKIIKFTANATLMSSISVPSLDLKRCWSYSPNRKLIKTMSPLGWETNISFTRTQLNLYLRYKHYILSITTMKTRDQQATKLYLTSEKPFKATNMLEQRYDYKRLVKKYSCLPLKRSVAFHLNDTLNLRMLCSKFG